MVTKRIGAVLVAGLALLAMWQGAPTQAAEGDGGSVAGVVGIVTSKGDTWIEVQADGAHEAVRYFPFWRGGLPKDGGGFDAGTLRTIKELKAGNRVRLAWKFEERPRVVSVETLRPVEQSGALSGVVTAKGQLPHA